LPLLPKREKTILNAQKKHKEPSSMGIMKKLNEKLCKIANFVTNISKQISQERTTPFRSTY